MSFVLYEPVRNAIAGDVPRNEIPFYKRVLAGGTAGGISIIMVNPTDVIKTQMQAHKGDTAPRMRDIFSGVMRNAGVGGLWRGWQPNVARCFIGNACEIGCYDEVKTRIVGAVRLARPKCRIHQFPEKALTLPPSRSQGVPDGPASHFVASGVAGTVSAIFSTPVDVVKTRLMAQAGGVETAGVVQYSGVIDCFMRMPQLEGVASLYKGFVPIAARKVCWTIAYFLTYEQVMKLLRGSYS